MRTFETLITVFYWDKMRNEVEEFLSECILYISSETGSKIHLPLSSRMHVKYPDHVRHFEYLYLGPSAKSDMYALLLKDKISWNFWMEPTAPKKLRIHLASNFAAWADVVRSVLHCSMPQSYSKDGSAPFLQRNNGSVAMTQTSSTKSKTH